MPRPEICDATDAPARPILVDTHCHTFNGADLPVEGFIKRAVLGLHGGVIERLVAPLVRLIGKLADISKSAAEEEEQLDEMLAAGIDPMALAMAPPAGPAALEAVPAEADLNALADDDSLAAEPEDGPFAQHLEAVLTELAASQDPEDQELYVALSREVAAEDTADAAPEVAFAGPVAPVVLAAGLLTVGGTLARYIRWARLMTRFRFKIIRRLINTYGKDQGCVDLFTPAQVDLAEWLEDAPNTSQETQVDLMEKTIRLFRGRIHPLVAFDPWRESLDPGAPGGPFDRTRKAVEERGFVGVKVYPPMGFSALQNEDHDFTLLPDVPTEEASRIFGKGLDDALRALYGWCAENSVPVMAHAEATLGSRPRWEFRAHPNFWRLALSEFPGLRINLAHFGGPENLVEWHNGWTQAIGRLMEDEANVYSDFGHFSEIEDDAHRREIFDGLARFLETYPTAVDRLMFGTDWVLLAKERGSQHYFRYFAEELSQRFDDTVTAKILGGNAVRFFGLREGEPNRLRLERFWARHGIDPPPWTRRITSS